MTNLPEFRKRLAIGVMGWPIVTVGAMGSSIKHSYPCVTEDEDGLYRHWIEDGKHFSQDWHPDKSLDQAFMVAKKAGYLTLTEGSIAWHARIESCKGGSVSAFAVEPALAISLAADDCLRHSLEGQ